MLCCRQPETTNGLEVIVGADADPKVEAAIDTSNLNQKASNSDDTHTQETTDTSKSAESLQLPQEKPAMEEQDPAKNPTLLKAPCPAEYDPVNDVNEDLPKSNSKNSSGSKLTPPDPTAVRAQPKHPSWLQRRLMLWTWDLVRLGFKQSLEQEQLPNTIPGLNAKTVAVRGEEIWSAEIQKNTPGRALGNVLWKLFRGSLIAGVALNILHGLLVGVAKPLMLHRVINDIEGLTYGDVIALGMVLFFEAAVQLWMKQVMGDEVIPGVFAVCASLLAKRMPYVAKASGATTTSKTAGKDKKQVVEEIVPEPTLIAQDLTRTLENAMFLYMLPSAIVQLISAICTLTFFLGPTAFIGIAYCVFAVVCAGMIAKMNKKTDKKGLEAADVRVATLRQILEGIRFIKLAAWEESYAEKMGALRKIETTHYKSFRSFEMMSAAMGRTTPAIAAMITFVSLAIFGTQLKPAEIFASLSIFLSLRLPLGILPASFVLGASAVNSMVRVSKTLSQEQAQVPPLPENASCATSMSDAEFRWSSEAAPALRAISFTVNWGQMVAVVGPVASGKSTLLTSILGGLSPASGTAALCSDAVAYIPQRPVVFSGTVLMNITMGHPYNEALLISVLEAAQFMRDLELMPHGLGTEIGERGTTLSGGQQTRLNIARAFYHQPNLIVADDPLAAVDVHVASAIFGALQSWMRYEGSTAPAKPQRAVIMAMNQLHLIPQFDHVLYLEDSTIAVQGSPATVEAEAKTRPALAQLLESARVAMSVDDIVADAPVKQNDEQDQEAVKRASVTDVNRLRLSMVAFTEQGKTDGNLVKKEHRQRGALEQSIWVKYLIAVGGPWTTTYALSLCAAYGLLAANDWWLARWMQRTRDGTADDTVECSVYAALALCHTAWMLILCFVSGHAGAHASQNLHSLCLAHILKAPMSWYEETPSGRTVSRMSSDLSSVDLRLPTMFDHMSQMCMMMGIILTTICIMVPWMLIFLVVLLPAYVFLDVAVNRSSREVKRLTNSAMSPILTLVQEAANSRLLLRVTGQGPWLLERTMTSVDTYNSGFFAAQSLMGFLRFVGTTIGASVSVGLSFLLCAYPELSEMTPGGPVTLGLALTYSFVIPYFLSFVSLFWSMLRLLMASLERLLELQSDLVPHEQPWLLPSDPPASWPEKGLIEFKSVVMCYRPGLPAAVNDLSLTVAGGERLGVVGRTGAGKSSLSVLLLRIVELSGGSVFIDGINVSQIGLQTLRRAVAVVPQDPFLFKGPVSQNLDPFNKLQHPALTTALQSVGLTLKLEDDVGAGGEQLSSGERQLIAIARATLSSARIVLMDEPTANCDAQTDAHLQELVRAAFSQRTVLCIAHRLNTIMSYDRILVMEAGKAIELDTPDALMADPSTKFAQMVAGMQASTGEDQKE